MCLVLCLKLQAVLVFDLFTLHAWWMATRISITLHRVEGLLKPRLPGRLHRGATHLHRDAIAVALRDSVTSLSGRWFRSRWRERVYSSGRDERVISGGRRRYHRGYWKPRDICCCLPRIRWILRCGVRLRSSAIMKGLWGFSTAIKNKRKQRNFWALQYILAKHNSSL